MYYIGNFVFNTNQEQTLESDRRHGEFSLIITADDPVAAIWKFRDRIVKYRQESEFFQGDCTVYMIQLFEFDRFPDGEAMMLNFKSVAGDPLMPFIRCSLPSDLSDSCRISDWKNNIPEIDGKEEKLFLRFAAGSGSLLEEPHPGFLLAPEKGR